MLNSGVCMLNMRYIELCVWTLRMGHDTSGLLIEVLFNTPKTIKRPLVSCPITTGNVRLSLIQHTSAHVTCSNTDVCACA